LQIIEAANEVVRSVDVDELARFLLDKTEPEDDEAEVCYYITYCVSYNVIFFIVFLTLSTTLITTRLCFFLN